NALQLRKPFVLAAKRRVAIGGRRRQKTAEFGFFFFQVVDVQTDLWHKYSYYDIKKRLRTCSLLFLRRYFSAFWAFLAAAFLALLARASLRACAAANFALKRSTRP